jgi:hypothetical protein
MHKEIPSYSSEYSLGRFCFKNGKLNAENYVGKILRIRKWWSWRSAE